MISTDLLHWPLYKFVEYPGNPRKNDHAVAQAAAAIEKFGFRVPILAKSDGLIIDGHLRLKAARQLGLATVPVLLGDDMSDAQIKAFRLSVNKIADLAGWDEELLAFELDGLRDMNFDMATIGFAPGELNELIGTPNTGRDADEVPPPPVVPVSRSGDLWAMGAHRLLCGDSTKAEDVARLMGGIVPDIAIADPPYGINAVKGGHIGGAKPFGNVGGGGMTRFGRVHGRAKNAIIEPGMYAPIVGDDTTDTAIAAHHMLVELAVPVIVMWGGNYFANALPASRCWLVWDKVTNGNFADAELAWTNQDRVVELLRHQWSGLIKASERGEKRTHPTQKPVALAEWVIATLAPNAASVFDPFLGSGWTLIACERTKRTCLATELAPAYIDVCILRWQNFSGKAATLDGTGQTFDEVKRERAQAVAA